MTRYVVAVLMITLVGWGQLRTVRAASPDHAAREQLSIGYSLLYQEADGIPKLQWIFMVKDKTHEMGRLSSDLVSYYEHLAESMRTLSEQYPAMRIDRAPMSKIESDTRKAIGEDQAKDFAPLVGKTGVKFERGVLLMLYDALNEQRHLVAVMLKLETTPALRTFLDTTKRQLDVRYAKVGELLEHRYFTQ